MGRYQVLRPLAKGGMAEVLLARSIGIKGFERFVVLKRVLVQHESQHSTEMFLDEARLVAGLHHRNIVQVHDIGETDDGKYFFAMEYVHGEDCRALLRAVKDKKEQIPLEHLLTIVSAAATGLHYAHEQRGPDRKPLGIVHRDISPGNILIGFDGGVKVVDFGIAKTETQAEHTQAGEMKGKVGYMSPEQCKALPIDRRTDVFMLGIVLYELATVRRLFKGENKYDTMQAIVGGTVPPPSRFRKDLPEELEKIILKALAVDPADRYQTADDLRLVLDAFAMRNNLQISATRLSDYMKDLFGERPLPWLVEELPPMPKLVVDWPVVRGPAEPAATPAAATDAVPPAGRTSSPAIAPPGDAAADQATGSESTPMSWPLPPGPVGKPVWFWPVIGGAAVITIAVVGFLALTQDNGTPKPAKATETPVVGKGSNTEPPPPAATPDAAVEQAAAATPDAAVAVEPVTTPDAGVEVATKPTRPTRPVRPIIRHPRPDRTNKTDKPDTPPGGGSGDDLDSPFPK
ncbi:MAG TPA: serine/threonine-protein kinase [Kofleriaceae bacterium]|nr:serine/threonine-protein kinase [Kofleriaceae bacterium]